MIIKVARLGTAVQDVALTDGAKVEDALVAAGLEVDGEEIRVNQSSASTSSALSDGDIVTLVPKVKGGQKIVKVARLGTAVEEVAVADDATVQDALDAAGIEIENEDVRVDGSSSAVSSMIGSGSLITIVPKVKGGK